MTARLYSLCFSEEKNNNNFKKAGDAFLDFFSYLKKCWSFTEKKAMHRSPRTVASCPHLIANRVAVVLLGPLGHFLFLCLLTVLWVNMGQALNNFKEHLSHTKSNHCLLFWVSKTMSASLTWQLRLSCKSSSSPELFKKKVCDTCQTWGEVWARVLMAMWEGCFTVSAMPNWAVPDCMEHPRADRRRLHYLYWSRWCVSYILHRRLCFFSVDSWLCLTPKLRQQRYTYIEVGRGRNT